MDPFVSREMAKPHETEIEEIQPCSATSFLGLPSLFPAPSRNSPCESEIESLLMLNLAWLSGVRRPEESIGKLKYVQTSSGGLDRAEKCIAHERRQVMEMEMRRRGLPDKIIEGDMSLLDAKVKQAFARVRCVHEVASELGVHNSRLRHHKHEIQTTCKFLECIFKEIDGMPSFVGGRAYEELRRFNEQLMNVVAKWNSPVMEKGAESSGERRKPQSKGVISKRNALRRQHNSQRDDPEELFPDLVELETTLEDCLFDLPQLVAFVEGLSYDGKMPMIQLSNQGCGKVNQLSMAGISAVVNELVFVV